MRSRLFAVVVLLLCLTFWGSPNGVVVPVHAQTGGCPSDSRVASGMTTINPNTGLTNNPICIDNTTGRFILWPHSIVFEGATEDAFETTISVTDPTADRTLTIPNVGGTLLLQQGTTITLTNVDLDTADNSIAAHVCELQVVTATGVVATDNIVLTMTSTDLNIVFSVSNPVPATDQLSVRVCNNSAGAVDPGAVADFRVVRLP